MRNALQYVLSSLCPFLDFLNLLFRTIKSRNFVLCNICFKLRLLHTPYDFPVQGDLQSMLIIKTPTMDREWGASGEDVCHLWNLEKMLFISRWDRDALWSKGKAHGHPKDFYIQGLFEFWLQPRPMSPHSLWFYFSCIAYFQGGIWVSEVLWKQTLWDNVKGCPW